MREDSTPSYQLGGPMAAFLRCCSVAALLLSVILVARVRARSASRGIIVRFPLNSSSRAAARCTTSRASMKTRPASRAYLFSC
jgi:hypothetical protein